MSEPINETSSQPEIPEKFQKILGRLKKDTAQADLDPEVELKKNVKTNLTGLGVVEIWASRGKKEDADQLMRLGLEKIKSFYPENVPLIDSAISESIAELKEKHGEDNLFAKIIEENRGVLHKDDSSQ